MKKKWNESTAGKSYIQNLRLGPGKYKSAYILIEGHKDRHTGVETVLKVNGTPVKAENSGSTTNWDEVRGTSSLTYFYNLESFAGKDILVEVGGYITSKNIFVGGGACVTLKCIRS